MMKLSFLFIAFLLATATATSILACTSTSEDFRVRSLTVNVQPSQPVLVQRYQAPNIRIFCFTTLQTAGIATSACPSSSSSNVILCSRRADEPDSLAICETFISVTSMIERGSINGPDMIWDLMWDGSSLAAQCFPRSVEFSYLALVRGTEVASIALFVVLLIIAILAVLLGFCSLGVFARQRIYRFDGAVTMAGPKGTFAGHQMQVRGGAAEQAQASYDGTVPTVYLPVRSGGAGSPLYGAEGQELTEEELAEMAAQNAEHQQQASRGIRGGPGAFTADASRQMRDIAKKGASPPRPGDAIEGFEGAHRDMDFEYADGAGSGGRYLGGGSTGPRSGARGGDSIRRRRGYRPDRRGGPEERRNKALFPTHYDWEKNDGFSGYAGGLDDEYGDQAGRPDRFDRQSSGQYVDENGNPMSAMGPRHGVRYIPQWMHSFHGRDEAENPDSFEPNDGLNHSRAGSHVGADPLSPDQQDLDGAIPVGKSRGLQVSELGVYNKPPRNAKMSGHGGKKLSGVDGDEEGDGYESEGPGGKKVRFAGGEHGSRPGSQNNSRKGTPSGNFRSAPPGSGSGEQQQQRQVGGGAGSSKYAPKHVDPATGDRFNRDRATAFGKSLSLGKNRDFVDGGAENTGADRVDVKRRFQQEDYTTTVIGGKGGETVLQCAHCKVLLDGTAPRFCPTTGERHV